MTATVRAVVRGIGNRYADGTESIEIHVPVGSAQGLPYLLGTRVEIELSVDGTTYRAGLRSTERNKFVWICPNVVAPGGVKARLADIVTAAGWNKNDRVFLVTDGLSITVKPASWA